jgi:uncharacterized OB-fold protein
MPMVKICPQCQAEMSIQAVSEIHKRGCLTTLIYIILLFIPVVGWIILFLLVRGNKSETVSIAVCQNCGHRIRL